MAESWSFVSIGQDGVQETDYMHFKREINYYDYTIFYILYPCEFQGFLCTKKLKTHKVQ